MLSKEFENEEFSSQDRQKKREGQVSRIRTLKKLFSNSALKKIANNNSAQKENRRTTSPTLQHQETSSHNDSRFATKRFYSNRNTAGLMEPKTARVKNSSYTLSRLKNRDDSSNQFSKTQVGFTARENAVLPGANHPHLAKASSRLTPRVQKQFFSNQKERKETKSLTRVMSPHSFIKGLIKKEDSPEVAKVESKSFLLNGKKGKSYRSQFLINSGHSSDFNVRQCLVKNREVQKMPLKNSTLRKKHQDIRSLNELQESKELAIHNEKNISAMLSTKSDVGRWDIDKSNEYNELLQEFSLARQLFPYFQNDDKFSELLRSNNLETLNHLKRDPILNMTRAQLPGLAPVLRRIRAVSPLMLIGQLPPPPEE